MSARSGLPREHHQIFPLDLLRQKFRFSRTPNPNPNPNPLSYMHAHSLRRCSLARFLASSFFLSRGGIICPPPPPHPQLLLTEPLPRVQVEPRGELLLSCFAALAIASRQDQLVR